MPPASPITIADYDLLESIGSGAYGEVWLARNQATGARRAIKIVYRATFTDERPFNREFEGIKKFEAISHSHPTQLALFHVGRNKNPACFYYVMELADPIQTPVGDDVRSLTSPPMQNAQCPLLNAQSSASQIRIPQSAIRNSYTPRTLRSDLETGRFPAPRVLQLALALTEALSHLHQNNLIHRDIKPSNIIFVQGRPKLADIGLVTDASDSRSIVGTEGYLAPEGPGTPKADLFALGKVLYEALTGLDRRQFPELPADIRQWPDAKLAFELNTIILKLCASHLQNRYSTASEAITDLEYLARGKSVQRRHWLRHARSTALKATLALTLLLAALILFLRPQRAKELHPRNSDFASFGTTNFAAWEAYSRAGMISWNFDPSGFSNAIRYYERAVQLDPNFTAAWGNLAMATLLSVEKGYIAGPNALPRALAAAEKALTLDPKDSRALHWKAYCILALDYDFARAQPLFEKAIEIEPYWGWRHNYAAILWYYGQVDRAEKLLLDVQRQAPDQGHPHLVRGYVLASRGQVSEGLSEINDAILLYPTYPMARMEHGLLLWRLGRRDEAAAEWRKFIELGGFPMLGSNDPSLAEASKLGPEQFLRTLIAQLEKCRAEGIFVSAFDLARFYAVLGDKPHTLDYLEAAVDEHRPFALCAKVHHVFHDFQEEPRYHAALRRFKLE